MRRHKIFVLNHESQFHRLQPESCILVHDKISTIRHLNERYGEAIKQIHFNGTIDEAADIEKKEKQVVKIFTNQKEKLITGSDMMRDKGFYICPRFPVSTQEDISQITSRGLGVDLIHTLDSLTPALASTLLDHYLHDTSLAVPVEPFHVILTAKMSNSNLSLWHLNKIYPGLFYYADLKGLSEEPDDLKQGKYHLLFAERDGIVKPTKNTSTAQQFLNSIPERHSRCLACPHFHICTSWAVYKKDSCRTWTEILDRIQSASRDLQKMAEFGQTPPASPEGSKTSPENKP